MSFLAWYKLIVRVKKAIGAGKAIVRRNLKLLAALGHNQYNFLCENTARLSKCLNWNVS